MWVGTPRAGEIVVVDLFFAIPFDTRLGEPFALRFRCNYP